MDSSRRHPWNQLPAWMGRLLAGSAIAACLLAALVSAIALAAQSAANSTLPIELRSLVEQYSVLLHALAMTSVAALTVAVAAALVRLDQQLLAGVVIVAAVAGPMTLVAAPMKMSLDEFPSNDAALWWRVTVAAVLAAVVSGWVWWVNRCLNQGFGVPTRSGSGMRVRQVAAPALFGVAAALSIMAYAVAPQEQYEPVVRGLVGWSALAAGIVVVTVFARTWWVAAFFFIGAAATLGLTFLAYTRLGGVPRVAGWEDATSPIVTSVASTAALLLAPILGALCRGLRLAAGRARAVGGASSAEVAGI